MCNLGLHSCITEGSFPHLNNRTQQKPPYILYYIHTAFILNNTTEFDFTFGGISILSIIDISEEDCKGGGIRKTDIEFGH